MVYITQRQSPRFKQLNLEDVMQGEINIRDAIIHNTTGTKTIVVDRVNDDIVIKADIPSMINALYAFNVKYEELRNTDKKELYNTYFIPKHSGGLRRIDDPLDDIREALYCLINIFNTRMGAQHLYHTSAFAYIKGRCAADVSKKHQQNESKWFAKTDFTNFFGNTTQEFVVNMFSMIFPFSEIVKNKTGKEELEKALSLCFLNGGLPQGSPISPMITNIMMIPIDHYICNNLRDYNDNHFIYTRYADDIQVSSRYDFSHESIVDFVNSVLATFNAPFAINPKKTRYGSSSGRNWLLGVMLNKDNEITIGHKKKKHFEAMINNYTRDKLNKIYWDKQDIMHMNGLMSYYKSIENDYVERILSEYSKKYNVNIRAIIKQDLKPCKL